MRYLVLLCLLLAACDPVVSETATGPAARVTRNESCTHTSFCYTMMPGFDGKMEGGFKLSPYCPGSHDVVYAVIPTRQVHKSGAVTTGESWVYISSGECQ